MKKHYLKLAAILFVAAIFLTACGLKAQGAGIPAAASISSPTAAPNAKLDGTVIRPLVKPKVEPEKTAWTYEDAKGVSYPVYRSEGGKLFYFKTSAKGTTYKAYITLQD